MAQDVLHTGHPYSYTSQACLGADTQPGSFTSCRPKCYTRVTPTSLHPHIYRHSPSTQTIITPADPRHSDPPLAQISRNHQPYNNPCSIATYNKTTTSSLASFAPTSTSPSPTPPISTPVRSTPLTSATTSMPAWFFPPLCSLSLSYSPSTLKILLPHCTIATTVSTTTVLSLCLALSHQISDDMGGGGVLERRRLALHGNLRGNDESEG